MSRSRQELTVNKNVFWPELFVTGPGLNDTGQVYLLLAKASQSDCGMLWIYANLNYWNHNRYIADSKPRDQTA